MTSIALSTAKKCMSFADSREGWVQSLRLLLESYFLEERSTQRFDYSQVRPAGLPIKGFGGISSGHEPLEKMLEAIRHVMDKQIGRKITGRAIVDVMNLIGVCA